MNNSLGKGRGQKLHIVKTWPAYYDKAAIGLKPWEIRTDDRDYQTGDLFLSRRWCPKREEYTGEQSAYRIVYIMRGEFLPKGKCAMTMYPVEITESRVGDIKKSCKTCRHNMSTPSEGTVVNTRCLTCCTSSDSKEHWRNWEAK
jgi:hypothetical protein